jgi:hypothetical protein
MAIATRRRAGRPSDHPGHPASACWSCATGVWPSSASQPSRSARARATPRADRPDRAATHRRRLPIRQVQHLGQHERRPPIRVQPPHQPPNTPPQQGPRSARPPQPGSRRLTAEQAAQPPSTNRIRARPPREHQQPRPDAGLTPKRRQGTPRPQKDLLGDVLGLVTIDQMGAHRHTSAWLRRMNAAKAKRSPSRAASNNRVSSSITPLLSLLGVQTDPRGHRSTDKSTDARIAHDRTARSLHRRSVRRRQRARHADGACAPAAVQHRGRAGRPARRRR